MDPRCRRTVGHLLKRLNRRWMTEWKDINDVGSNSQLRAYDGAKLGNGRDFLREKTSWVGMEIVQGAGLRGNGPLSGMSTVPGMAFKSVSPRPLLDFYAYNNAYERRSISRSIHTSSKIEGDVTIEVPPMAESITEGTVAAILKEPGDAVFEDDVIAQLETDKVTIDVKYQRNIPGTVKTIHFAEGDTVEVGQAFAEVEETPDASKQGNSVKEEDAAELTAKKEEKAPEVTAKKEEKKAPAKEEKPKKSAPPKTQKPEQTPAKPAPGSRPERRVKMTRLRMRVAERLKGAQNTYAMLTTFNEVDMTNLMSMRAAYKDEFIERHGVKLGFMSAFVKAASNALQLVPAVNGVIEEDHILYRDYYDVSVAVSTPKGLVVPVLRDVDAMSFADVEKKINELGRKARDGTLSIDEMAGGTFTISNGGVFGSLMGTPIINPPQSAILGMHATKLRPAVVDGEVKARPMMYLALTYDHRLVDGREAVTFLKRIKEIIEDPRRLLLDV